jgi:hypothetical protein
MRRRHNSLKLQEVPVKEKLEFLLEKAKKVQMTEAEQEEQRRSFAYGNTKIENDLITREMIDDAADRLAKKG